MNHSPRRPRQNHHRICLLFVKGGEAASKETIDRGKGPCPSLPRLPERSFSAYKPLLTGVRGEAPAWEGGKGVQRTRGTGTGSPRPLALAERAARPHINQSTKIRNGTKTVPFPFTPPENLPYFPSPHPARRSQWRLPSPGHCCTALKSHHPETTSPPSARHPDCTPPCTQGLP